MTDQVEPTAGHSEVGIRGASSKHLQFLQSTDGGRVPLVVQSLVDLSFLPEPLVWFRIGKPRSQVPSLIHVSNWIGAPTFKPGSEDRCYDPRAVLTTGLRLFLAWPLLCILVMGFDFVKGATSSHYDKVQTHEAPRRNTRRSSLRPLLQQEHDNLNTEASSGGLQAVLASESQHYHDSEDIEIPGAEEGYPFTIVDTWMMTVTHVRCQRPPVVMLLCGHHAGMQRALLCSYDWESNTFCRETVLRVGSRILDQMQRVGRVRLALNTKQLDHNNPEPASSRINSDLSTEQPNGTLEPLDNDLSMFRDTSRTWIVEFLFLCLVFLAIGVFDANLTKSSMWLGSTSYAFYYHGGFLAAQPLAYFLITTVPTNRLFPSVALLKGWETVISAVRVNWDSFSLEVWSVSSGIINGILLAILITLIFSWFPLKQAPFRLVLVAVFGREIRQLLGFTLNRGRGSIPFPLTTMAYVVLCFLLATFGSSIIGRPLEVPWLAGHQRVFFSSHAALPTLEAEPSPGNWKFLKQRPLYYYQLLSIFALSMASSIIAVSSSSSTMQLEFVTLVVGIVLAFALYRWAHLSVHVATVLSVLCCILRGIAALDWLSTLCNQGIALGQVVLPLVWFIIVDSSTKQEEVISLLSFSLGGKALGGMLLRAIFDKSVSAILEALIFGILSLTIAIFMQIYACIKKRTFYGHETDGLVEAGGSLRL